MRVHEDWLLTPHLAAVHLPTMTAVIADLHLGYNEARRRGGEAVPLPCIGDTLAPLSLVASRYGARRLVVAGDLFETAASEKLIDDLLGWLAAAGLELAAIVPGNHDRDINAFADRLPLCPDGVMLEDWRILHGHKPLPKEPVVYGHYHPSVRFGKGRSAPCYLVGPRCLILPAFSTDASGLNVFKNRNWRSYRCCVPAGESVLDFGAVSHTVLS